MKIMGRIEEGIIQKEISRRARDIEGDSTIRKMIDSYIVGDFFEQVKKLPSDTFDVVEIDTPYAIDLPKLRKVKVGGKDKLQINYGDSYNEISKDNFESFAASVLKECYRVMNDHSWLVWWFAHDWSEVVYNLIIGAGFKTNRVNAVWTKPQGQTNQPDQYLANSYERFHYARKGNAVINMNRRGRSNVFDFPLVPPSKKIHPTERPIELVTEILSVFGFEGARVYVPFCGSGNTLRAAFDLKMYPVGVDLGREYKDAYVTRIVTDKEGK